MIVVQNLEKRYGAIRAVSDVSFKVAKGEIVGLLGQNGAGKTTVMKVMTGFLEPTQGTVTVGGIDVRTDRLGVQRQIGYLPENAPLYPEMLVQEYLLMMAELRGLPPERRARAVADAVVATGLEARLVQPIGTLSKGFRQRVGLAQAILHKPEVLVLDEPTNGLDPVQIVEIRELIRRLARTTTVILSTHILSEIEAVCNRVVILIHGNLAADARLDELLASNVVKLTVDAAAKDVARALSKVEGVDEVRREGERDGKVTWRAICAQGSAPAPAIARVAAENGWTLYALAPEQPNLEQRFRDLMAEHVEKARGKAA
ncbi:MAG: ATP-binding cassette domain-containing protein [Myxococcales bacterium]|nr:ATP-binding cassette domain-containing protein [Myxococcales bacterium]